MKILAIGTLIAATVLTAGAALPALAGAGAALAATSVALGTVSMTTGIIGGVQAKRSADARAQQQELQLQGEKTQAALEAESLQQKLSRTLATQNAIFGNSNVSLSDGTPSIIAGDTFNQAEVMQRQANLQNQTRQSILGMQIKDTRQAGETAMNMAFMNAGASLISSGLTASTLGKVPTMNNQVSPLGPVTNINPAMIR